MIRLEKVSKRYGTAVKTTALHPCDLTISQGELIVILGPSGSGKTTLLNLIGGLDQASDGSVTVANRQLDTLTDDELGAFRKDVIGFVFQFFNLIPSLTVQENVELVAGLRHKEAVEAVPSLLNSLGIQDLADRFPAEISGGQQQRVAIARALAKRPTVLLADEPTGALDETSGKSVLEQLEKCARVSQMVVIIVTHHTAVGAMADRVIRLKDGHIFSDTLNPNPTPAAELSW